MAVVVVVLDGGGNASCVVGGRPEVTRPSRVWMRKGGGGGPVVTWPFERERVEGGSGWPWWVVGGR